jgi:hypothetical protein
MLFIIEAQLAYCGFLPFFYLFLQRSFVFKGNLLIVLLLRCLSVASLQVLFAIANIPQQQNNVWFTFENHGFCQNK